MSKFVGDRSLVTLAFSVLLLAHPGAPAGAEEDAFPDPIGFVELDGVGRFDIHPMSEGMTANEAGRPIYSDGSRPTAFWRSFSDRGGAVAILAQAAPGDPTQGSIWIEFHLADDRTDLSQRQSRGVTYLEPHEGRFGHGWQQRLMGEVTVEEVSVTDERSLTLKLSFDGRGARANLHTRETSDEVRMRGRVEVEGLPFADN